MTTKSRIKLEIQQVNKEQINQITAFAERKNLAHCGKVALNNGDVGILITFEPSQLAMVTNFLKKVL